MKVSRFYFQIYSEFTDFQFDGKDRTIHTLRAAILNRLASLDGTIFHSYEPRRKEAYGYFEDVIKIFYGTDMAEIKFGVTEDKNDKIYLQTSVERKEHLEKIHAEITEALEDFFMESEKDD